MSARNGPGDSRGGPLVTDRPTAENHPGESKFASEDTATVRQNATRRTDTIHVWAVGYYTVGTRGRVALTMVVLSCVFCGRAHRHNGKPDFLSGGKRTASCHGGTYLGRPEIEPATYLTAIHAIVLDLVQVTGAPTNGRRHPAHAELLESIGLVWS